MKSKAPKDQSVATDKATDIEGLYHDLLNWFYGKKNRSRAEQVARQLETALTEQPDVADSIRGEEIQSLLAEMRGDLPEAARCRETEIRKIFELHDLAKGTPGWDYVFRHYDYGDISDRLDLLAMLYAEQGYLDRAIKTLHESKRFCESHGIPFDGGDVLEELEQARRKGANHAKKKQSSGKRRAARTR